MISLNLFTSTMIHTKISLTRFLRLNFMISISIIPSKVSITSLSACHSVSNSFIITQCFCTEHISTGNWSYKTTCTRCLMNFKEIRNLNTYRRLIFKIHSIYQISLSSSIILSCLKSFFNLWSFLCTTSSIIFLTLILWFLFINLIV